MPDVLTFREKTTISVTQVFAEEPSISKLVVPFDKLDTVALGQAQLV